jgi:nucleoside-diphosphate-sugar epimerase
MNVIVTGSSGFYGSILINYLKKKGIATLGLDLHQNKKLEKFKTLEIDLCKSSAAAKIIPQVKFDAIIHLATLIDFGVKNQKKLYKNNINTTKTVIQLAKRFNIAKIIFTSSNSIFLGSKETYITRKTLPCPRDAYGKSKLASEKLLIKLNKKKVIHILRCPNIVDAGRMGMLSILFELLENNSTIWMIGDGSSRHQCIYANDLNEAILKLLKNNRSSTLNIGSENVPSFLELYQFLVKKTKSKSKIRALPKFLVIPILKLLYFFGLSPLGPYQFRMLTKDFIFDISEIRNKIKWTPTKNNKEIMHLAYKYYLSNRAKNITSNTNNSLINMKLLSILKYLKF